LDPIFTTDAHVWSIEIVNADGQTSGQFRFNVQAIGGEIVKVPGNLPFIHQLFDTSDDFNAGHDSCGIVSTFMAIQHYAKLPPNPIICSRGGTHSSPFGFYVSEKYSFQGHTFNIPSENVPGWGASDAGYFGGFGYFLQDNPGGSLQRSQRLAEIISLHGLTSEIDENVLGETGFLKICGEIDAGNPVVLLSAITSAGHYLTCIGYVRAQHTLLFNDPYGNKQEGYPNANGAGVYYDWPGWNNGYPNLGSVIRIIYARDSVPQKEAALSWNPTEVEYGVPLKIEQLNLNATVSGQPVAGTFSLKPPIGTFLEAGNQIVDITFTPADSTKYLTTTKTATLNVLQANLTITANDRSKAFGDAIPALTASYSGFVNGDTAASLITPATLATTATAASPAGTYPIAANGATSPNYTIAFVDGSLTVNSEITKPSLITVLTGGSIEIRFSGPSGQLFKIEESADFINWFESLLIDNDNIATNRFVAEDGIISAIIPIPNTKAQCFYRLFRAE
jgi:hypothetical protein